jgi:hypothetical protein
MGRLSGFKFREVARRLIIRVKWLKGHIGLFSVKQELTWRFSQ